MGLIFLTILTLAEITLLILTFIKFKSKSEWRKNRFIFRAAEAALLLAIVLLPVTNFKWRFFAAAGVLIVWLIIAAASFFAKRKKTDGSQKKARAVVSCVLSVVIISLALVPAFIFTNYNCLKTTGKYKISEVSAVLVDKSRLDEFENDGSFCEVPAHFYYPDTVEGDFPLIVFSHGAFGYYQSNFSTYAELASNGYVVAALDHPHHSFFTKGADGKIVTVDSNFISDVLKINEETSNEEVFNLSQDWLELRTADEGFVLDCIKSAKDSEKLGDEWNTDEAQTVMNVLEITDTEKIGLIGHSLGGASGVALGRERGDIDAVVDLDGTMLGEIKAVENGRNVYYSEPYPIPVLDFTKESDYNDRERYKSENGYPYVNEYVIDNSKDGKTVIFSGVEHMDFTDLPLISPFLASMLGSGDVNHEETLNTVNGIVLNWFNYYLKNEGTLDIQAKY